MQFQYFLLFLVYFQNCHTLESKISKTITVKGEAFMCSFHIQYEKDKCFQNSTVSCSPNKKGRRTAKNIALELNDGTKINIKKLKISRKKDRIIECEITSTPITGDSSCSYTDKDPDCSKWKEPHCTSGKWVSWMATNCAKTCKCTGSKGCSPLPDSWNRDCSEYLWACKNSTYPWFKEVCSTTCNYCGAAAASSREAVALDCGTVLTLNNNQMMDVEFKSIKGITGVCEFTIEGPKDNHVEVACDGGSGTVDGKYAADYHGPLPAVIKFNLKDDQIFCRVGLEEEHQKRSALHGMDGTDTNIQEFNAAYNVHEKNETYRAGVLAANEQLVREINDDFGKFNWRTWRARVTNMADKTEEEMQNLLTGKLPPPSQEEQNRRTMRAERELLAPLRMLRQTLPASVDLTTIGRVSPAKNQDLPRGCGSCSVFAGVSTIESCFHKETGRLPTDLSEQHMLDCAYGYGGKGCSGGSTDDYHRWMYSNHNGGLANEADYPYRAATTGRDQCENKPNANTGAKVTSHQESWSSSEEDIMMLLAAGHSVSTGMMVYGDFKLYGSGIYQSDKCTNCRADDGTIKRGPQDHDITIVGYGVENGVKYWKLKNSWGTGWGENGFVKFIRGKGHCCLGIDFSVPLCTATGTAPTPTTAAPVTTEPATVGTCGGTITNKKGSIILEGYPKAYKGNQDCTWTFKTAGNGKFKFTVESLDIEKHGKCGYDYVQFSNSADSYISLGSDEASIAGKLCGSSIPAPIFSSGNSAIIKFHSDGSIQGKGFKINYEYVESASCKNQRLHTAMGVGMVSFSTLGYPSNYANDQNCDWTITVPEGQIVNLMFDAFDTEYNYDKVTIYDGSSTSANKLGTYHGVKIPSLITSTGRAMLVTFNSDYMETRKGFKAKAAAAVKSHAKKDF